MFRRILANNSPLIWTYNSPVNWPTFSAPVAAVRQGCLPSYSPSATRPGRIFWPRFSVKMGSSMAQAQHESTLINPCQIIASNNLCFGILLSGLLELSGKNMWLSSPEGGGSGLEWQSINCIRLSFGNLSIYYSYLHSASFISTDLCNQNKSARTGKY